MYIGKRRIYGGIKGAPPPIFFLNNIYLQPMRYRIYLLKIYYRSFKNYLFQILSFCILFTYFFYSTSIFIIVFCIVMKRGRQLKETQ